MGNERSGSNRMYQHTERIMVSPISRTDKHSHYATQFNNLMSELIREYLGQVIRFQEDIQSVEEL